MDINYGHNTIYNNIRKFLLNNIHSFYSIHIHIHVNQ